MKDKISGDKGDDYAVSSEGNDVLIGGAGNDQFFGGAGMTIYVVIKETTFCPVIMEPTC